MESRKVGLQASSLLTLGTPGSQPVNIWDRGLPARLRTGTPTHLHPGQLFGAIGVGVEVERARQLAKLVATPVILSLQRKSEFILGFMLVQLCL